VSAAVETTYCVPDPTANMCQATRGEAWFRGDDRACLGTGHTAASQAAAGAAALVPWSQSLLRLACASWHHVRTGQHGAPASAPASPPRSSRRDRLLPVRTFERPSVVEGRRDLRHLGWRHVQGAAPGGSGRGLTFRPGPNNASVVSRVMARRGSVEVVALFDVSTCAHRTRVPTASAGCVMNAGWPPRERHAGKLAGASTVAFRPALAFEGRRESARSGASSS
jgi:hypothetical protein